MRSPVKVSLLDRMISVVAPQTALNRIKAKAVFGSITNSVSRSAAGRSGSLSNWITRRLTRFSEATEREKIIDRAEDLYANDAHATSIIDSMSVNIVGTGITPQSQPIQKILGISDSRAADLQEEIEYAWSIWSSEADAGGRMPFWAIQYLSIHSMLVKGEFLRVPVIVDDPKRTFQTAIQCIHPRRLYTPSDLQNDARIRDGVRLGSRGEPVAYWIENPLREYQSSGGLSSSYFRTIPAWNGLQPGCFHGFIPKDEEQVRGVSILAPCMKMFRDLNDYLDFELVGAIIAASFAVFIENSNPYDITQNITENDEDSTRSYQETTPGQIMYGKPGEKPHILTGSRPGDTFDPFVQRIIRAVGASVGMPYEVIAKDFSKTNYSSARAALLEAQRVFRFYQRWLIDLFCQPIWEMVIEEAFLRDMISGFTAKKFYEMKKAICRAQWVPPRRGHVDPTKEIEAAIMAIGANLTTLSEQSAEMGGDWETNLNQRAREISMQMALGLNQPTPAEKQEKNDDENDSDAPE